MPDQLNTTQVAEILGVSRRTVHRLVFRGHLDHDERVAQMTGAYLISAESVKDYQAGLAPK